MATGKMFRPERIDDLVSLLNGSNETVLARGGGTAFGDSSINDNGINIDTRRLNKMLGFDADKGILHCQGGVSLQDISRVFLPRGWFFAVTPGTQYATVGGCVASDAHGKNWKDGSFCNYVKGLQLMFRDGRVVHCDDGNHSDLFRATFGGMGMTGIILDVKFQLRRICSSVMDVEYIRCGNLKECFDVQGESMDSHEYIFCWIDSHREGSGMGRGILQRANHGADPELIYKEKKRFHLPFYLPSFTVNSWSVEAFNRTYFSSVKGKSRKSVYLMDFFYPLDGVADWYRVYGRKGFIEYQVVIPHVSAYETIRELLGIITRSKLGSTVAAIKPLCRVNGTMSFPMDGVTLAVDFMIHDRLWKLLEVLDKIVLASNGRVYLAKDARLSSGNFMKMYSEPLNAWDAVRARYDAGDGFSSMMFRRLRNGRTAIP